MAELNPYQSPDADVTTDRPLGTGERVYKIGHIGLATFLGAPWAGAWLMASNYVAMGKPEKRSSMYWLGIISTIVVLVVAFYLPEDIPALPFNAAIVVAMMAIGSSLQGEALKSYVEDESFWYSGWRAAGIGLLFMLGLIVLIFAILFIPVMFGYEHWLE